MSPEDRIRRAVRAIENPEGTIQDRLAEAACHILEIPETDDSIPEPVREMFHALSQDLQERGQTETGARSTKQLARLDFYQAAILATRILRLNQQWLGNRYPRAARRRRAGA